MTPHTLALSDEYIYLPCTAKQWWKNQNIACNRMTGLHFIEVEPWYNKTRPLIMDYRTKIEEKGVETFCKE
ncbi:hypothetical protein SARC_15145, partial [Sphaeroforma arctica JP610]